MHLYHAGQGCGQPHIVIHGESSKVQQFPIAGKSSDKVDAMVFVNQSSQNMVVPLSTSNYPGFHKPYETRKSSMKSKCGMRGQEVKSILHRLSMTAMKRRGVPHASKPVLIMDRHPVHKSNLIKQACLDYGVDLMLMPPASPDLSPLDSHLFGVVKNALHHEHPPERPWPERSKAFIELLEKADASKHIESWKRKLEKCVQAQGWHFKE